MYNIVEFPGCPVVRTLHFPCRGHGFNPWLGTKILHVPVAWPKKKKKKNCNIICISCTIFFKEKPHQHQSLLKSMTQKKILEIIVEQDFNFQEPNCWDGRGGRRGERHWGGGDESENLQSKAKINLVLIKATLVLCTNGFRYIIGSFRKCYIVKVLDNTKDEAVRKVGRYGQV